MKTLARLFGRKNDSKCKDWIKGTMKRIEELGQKSKAMEKFWTEDIVELLSRGLDSYAYSKAEKLSAEQNQISCYNLINRFCERILAHLSSMPKDRECPEQCKEAVSSLIFAAPRTSDAPQLLKLRDILMKRYEHLDLLGSSVHKEFAAAFELKSSSKDMKLQLLRDIAQRYMILWDSRALEQELSNIPPASDQAKTIKNRAFDGEGVQA